MSIRAINWAFEQKVGSASAKLVLIKLADNANDDGVCWPSHRYMEQHCELSRTAIKENIKKLVALDLLTIQERFKDGVQLPHVYHLNILASDCLPVQRSAGGVGRQVTGGGSPADPRVGRQTTTEPSYKPLIKPKSQSEEPIKLAIKNEDSEQVSRNKPPRQKCEALKYMDSIIEQNKDLAPAASILDIAGLGRGNGH